MTTAERARSRMVAALCESGRLVSPAVEDAFRNVPRHLFVPDLPIETAYADEAVAVQLVDGVATSSASQPSMMAIMLEQLSVRPGHRVLEIGAGTGYNAALMARIVGPTGSVTAVDIDQELIDAAGDHLAAAGVSGVHLVCADGALGYAENAPYDRIVLTVGSSDVRPEWVAQLSAGGRLLLPLAVRGSQLSVSLDLGTDGLLYSDSVRGCAFIRLRGIGAGPDTTVMLGDELAMLLPEDADSVPDPADVTAALSAPGPVQGSPVPLSPRDVWDGFGLWLALNEPRMVRLSANAPEGLLAESMFAVGPAYAGIALVGAGPGLAMAGPDAAGSAVRVFGPDGAGPAELLISALAEWEAAGCPQAADLGLVVAPRPLPITVTPGSAVVTTPNARVLTTWPATVT
ncbi:methyltransferase domain-containing protein [Actinomycetes bacterium KLBMP 9759]